MTVDELIKHLEATKAHIKKHPYCTIQVKGRPETRKRFKRFDSSKHTDEMIHYLKSHKFAKGEHVELEEIQYD